MAEMTFYASNVDINLINLVKYEDKRSLRILEWSTNIINRVVSFSFE
jgi:hypothetical protein